VSPSLGGFSSFWGESHAETHQTQAKETAARDDFAIRL